MIDYQQNLINSAYNQLIVQLVLWKHLTKKDYKALRNKEKLETIKTNIINSLPSFDGIDISNVRLWMPLVDDVKLLEEFKEIEL